MPGSTSAVRLTLLRVGRMVHVATRRRLGSHAPAAGFGKTARDSRSGRRKGTDDGLGAGSEAKIRTLGRKGGRQVQRRCQTRLFFLLYVSPTGPRRGNDMYSSSTAAIWQSGRASVRPLVSWRPVGGSGCVGGGPGKWRAPSIGTICTRAEIYRRGGEREWEFRESRERGNGRSGGPEGPKEKSKQEGKGRDYQAAAHARAAGLAEVAGRQGHGRHPFVGVMNPMPSTIRFFCHPFLPACPRMEGKVREPYVRCT